MPNMAVIGNYPTAVTRSVLNVCIQDSVFWQDANDHLETYIDEMIATYSTAKAYTTDLTVGVVLNHISRSIQAYVNFVTAFRIQNSSMARDEKGELIAPLYTHIHEEGYSVNDPDTYGSAQLDIGFMHDLTANISNAVWSRDYVSYLTQIKLPDSLVEMINSLFGYIHVLDSEKLSISEVAFWGFDVQDSAVVQAPHEAYLAAVADLEANYAAYPDLKIILGLLGFNSNKITDQDWTRSLDGNRVPRVTDPDITFMLVNSLMGMTEEVSQYAYSELVQDSILIPSMSPSDAINSDEYTIPYSALAYVTLFRGHMYLMNIAVSRINGNVEFYKSALPGRLTTAAGINNDASFEGLGESISLSNTFYSTIFGSNFIFRFTDVNGLEVNVLDPTSVRGAYQRFYIPMDNMEYLTDLVFATLIVGGPFRTKINELIRSIQPTVSAN